MSRTSQSEIVESPCKKFLQWGTVKETIIVDGDEVEKLKGGTFTYYDKENKVKVPIKLPLKFAILNPDLVCYKGYDEGSKQGNWSNEVRDPNHVVNFRNKAQKLLSFKKSEYKLNKDALAGYGAKYTQSVYIAVEVNKEFEIWNLQISGGSLSGAPADSFNISEEEKMDGWFSFTKHNKNKLFSNFVEVNTFKLKKKGATKFTIAVFELGKEIKEDDLDKLNILDQELNKYLDYYFVKPEAEEKEVLQETDY